jgi:uncharacterized protein
MQLVSSPQFWPPVIEAMYLLADLPKAQEALWEMLARGGLQLLPLDLADVPRMRELMVKYADPPMDLADAALIRVAEREGIRKIFTDVGARSSVKTVDAKTLAVHIP